MIPRLLQGIVMGVGFWAAGLFLVLLLGGSSTLAWIVGVVLGAGVLLATAAGTYKPPS